jgi:hypothetical protein
LIAEEFHEFLRDAKLRSAYATVIEDLQRVRPARARERQPRRGSRRSRIGLPHRRRPKRRDVRTNADLAQLNAGNLTFYDGLPQCLRHVIERWIGRPSAAIVGAGFSPLTALA